MAGSTQVSYNDLVKKASPRGAFMISNTWKDDTFGALISVAYTKRKLVEEGQSTVRWATGSAFAPGFGSPGHVRDHAGGLRHGQRGLHPRFPRYDISPTTRSVWGRPVAAMASERQDAAELRRVVCRLQGHARGAVPGSAVVQRRRGLYGRDHWRPRAASPTRTSPP
jgi:hypothetical protein